MFTRYAIFYTPPAGPFADAGSAWLGWDTAAGQGVVQPDVPGLDLPTLTAGARKYGFHATLKAPLRLAEGADDAALCAAVARFAARHAPVVLAGLAPLHMHGFIALRPEGDTTALSALAADIVRDLDRCRAPLNDAEIARRRRADLTARQDAQMLDWGYPYIFDDFHFHMTLTGSVDAALAAQILPAAAAHVTAPRPFAVDALSVMGEDEQGLFHQIDRFRLMG